MINRFIFLQNLKICVSWYNYTILFYFKLWWQWCPKWIISRSVFEVAKDRDQIPEFLKQGSSSSNGSDIIKDDPEF